MKILKLYLKAYGPFTDKILNFGDGQGSFHLVYGHNESGKTATLRALKALLFGIPERTADDFKHEGKKLRIGGSLMHSDGSIITFQRRKGRSKTLLTEDERELNNVQIEKFIKGVDEAAFSLIFAFGHEDFVQGGREIASGKGDIGESLFSAGAGISGLRNIQQKLDEEAGGLFKQGASRPVINEAITQYKEAKKKIKDSGLQPSWWVEHEQLLETAKERKEEAKKDLDTLQVKLNYLERIRQALPIISERKEVMSQIVTHEDALILPESFKSDRTDAINFLNSANKDKERADNHIKTINEKIESISIPEGLLNQKAVIETINVRLGSYNKEKNDLPVLKEQYTILFNEIENLFSELRPGESLDKAEKLRIGLQKRQHVLSMISQNEGLIKKFDIAIEQIGSLKNEKSRTEIELQEIRQPVDVSMLKKMTVSIQKDGDIEKVLKKAVLDIKKTENSIQKGLSKISSLWKGTTEELEGLPVPLPETIDRFEKEIDIIDNNIGQLESTIKDKTDELEQIENEVAELDHSGAVPTETDLEQSRTRRDEGWRLVKSIWIEKELDADKAKGYNSELPLDQAYEKNVSEADQIVDRLRRETDRVTQKALRLLKKKELLVNINTLNVKKGEVTLVKTRLLKDWGAIWNPLGFNPLTPKEMRSWLNEWRKLANDAKNLRVIHEDAGAIEESILKSRSSLIECLKAIGHEVKSDKTLADMIDESLDVININEEIVREKNALQRSIKGLEDQLVEADKKEKKIRKEIETWNKEWEKEMSDMDLAPNTLPSEVSDYITRSQDLVSEMDEAHRIKERITAIEKNMGDFENDVKQLVKRVSSDLTPLPVEQAVSELHSRLGKAVGDNITLMNFRQDLSDRERELESAMEAIEKAGISIKSLIEEAKCEHIDQLRDVEEKSDLVRDLKNNLEQLDKQLYAYSSGVKIEQFVAEVQKVDPDSLPYIIEDLQNEIATLKNSGSDLDQTIGAESALIKKAEESSPASTEAEKAQYIASKMEELVDRYIKLRLAGAILKSEIERYRASNQGPVLERASQIFATMTAGSFSGLRTTFDGKDAQILVGIRNSTGEDVMVEAMSEGTCDQLYLALRLASIEKYVESSEPVPLVFDDILVNFDDKRVGACLNILFELSKKTQIIYFTHHQHILDLALKSLSSEDLTVHKLQ